MEKKKEEKEETQGGMGKEKKRENKKLWYVLLLIKSKCFSPFFPCELKADNFIFQQFPILYSIEQVFFVTGGVRGEERDRETSGRKSFPSKSFDLFDNEVYRQIKKC